MKRLLLAFAWLLFMVSPGSADSLHVPGDYPTIQAAIDASAPGDEILIAAGTYAVSAEHGVPHGGLSFLAQGEVVLKGSAGAFFSLTTEISYALPVRFVGLRFEANSVAIRTRLPEPPFHPTYVEIEDCVFTGNGLLAVQARNVGGLSIFNSRFEGAHDGLYSLVSGLDMHDCVFLGQTTPALRCEDYSGTYPRLVEDCLFAGGRNASAAIAIAWGDNLTLRGCTVVDNGLAGSSVFQAIEHGGVSLERCIVADNHGRAFNCDDSGAEYSLNCCDVWGNAGGDWFDCMVGGPQENGNFSADPLFCDPAGGDYTIDALSPCAPAGNSCAVLIGVFGVDCGVTGVAEPPAAERTSVSALKGLY